jgi:transcriptional regulator with XRE-family HTH domain
MRIGELIAARRKEKGWSLRKLEVLSGVSNAVISQIETGHVKDPGFTTAVKLCDALHINPIHAFGAGRDPIVARDVLKVATKAVKPDVPAYADPNFKYDEATGSYRRIADASSPHPSQLSGGEK